MDRLGSGPCEFSALHLPSGWHELAVLVRPQVTLGRLHDWHAHGVDRVRVVAVTAPLDAIEFTVLALLRCTRVAL